MKVGDRVYTINALTNQVDTWTFNGEILTSKGAYCNLIDGKRSCYLPKRCVFKRELEAKLIRDFYE